MIKELKQLTKVSPRVYKAYVRRTATQIQTVDVEVIDSNFDVHNPNLNNYIYNVQISPTVLLYGTGVTIRRPLLNNYVIITKLDNGDWVVLVMGDTELHTLDKNEIVLKTNGKSFDISNIDGITLNKTTKLGSEDIETDEFSILLKGILVRIADRNATYEKLVLNNNYLGVNSVLRKVEVSLLNELIDDNITKIKRTLLNDKSVLLNNTFTNLVKNSYVGENSEAILALLDYIIWYTTNYTTNIVINDIMLEKFNTEFTSLSMYTTYSKLFTAKSLYGFFQLYYGMKIADRAYNYLITGNINLGVLKANKNIQKKCIYFFKKYGTGYISNNFREINLIFLNRTGVIAQGINELWNTGETTITTKDITDNILYTIERIYPFQYDVFKAKFSGLIKGLPPKLTSWNVIADIFADAISADNDIYVDILAKLTSNVHQESLGNIIAELVDALQSRTVTFPTPQGPAIGLLTPEYYKPVKLLNEQILKIY